MGLVVLGFADLGQGTSSIPGYKRPNFVPARSGKTFPFSGEPQELINDGNCPNQIFADGISCVIRRRGSKQREFELQFF